MSTSISSDNIVPPSLEGKFLAANTPYPNYYPVNGPYPIWVDGTDVLNQKASPIPTSWDGEIVSNLAKVLAYSVVGDAAAIAANQTGILWQMFLVLTTEFPNGVPVNPANQGPHSQPVSIDQVVSSTGEPVPAAPPTPRIMLPKFPSPMNDWTSFYVFINPVITPNPLPSSDPTNPQNKEKVWYSSEGCLSFPCYTSNVTQPFTTVITPRTKQFTLTFRTLNPSTTDPSGYALSDLLVYTSTFDENGTSDDNKVNWILQHETDHLNGILYTQVSTGTDSPNNSAYLTKIINGELGGVYNPNYTPPATTHPTMPSPTPPHPTPAA